MATIAVSCDFCGRSFSVPSSMIGKKVTCECGSVMQVSEDSGAEVEEASPGAEEESSEAPEDGWYVQEGGDGVGPHPLTELRRMARDGTLGPDQNVYHTVLGAWQPASSVDALSSEFEAPAPEPGQTKTQESQWYVRAGGEKYGPYTSDRIRQMIDKNQLRPRSRIWSAELDEWVELRKVKPFSSIWGNDVEEETELVDEKNSQAVPEEPPAPPTEEATPQTGENVVPDEGVKEETATKEKTGGSLTQNLKGLFRRGGQEGADRDKEAKVAQIPSTVLTVEYVDDSEGMDAALKEIQQSLKELEETTEQVQQYASRLARAVDQQNRSTNEAIESLRRRLDRLYRKMGSGAAQKEDVHPPPPPEGEELAEEGFGVPEEFSSDQSHQRAWQVAQVMASDLDAYHEEEVKEAVMYGNLEEILEEPIAEARETFEERTPENVRDEVDYFDMALNQLLAQKKREMEEEPS